MSDDELRERILCLPDGQLQRMVEAEADQYRPEAIAIANEELVRRGREPGAEPGASQEPDLDCLRCESKMVFSGQKRFHEGARLGVLGDLGELFVNREYFDLWVCPNCGHVEFFMETQC
ncbi:MAG: hypothetical protein HN919_16980 [Verrucomicrobia bacterium]|nr:hypothetical protein [Verrucomicrobiota bacterium]MBT7698984.1 hypothetical protein [Verrucomicrobiota bacterium]